MSDLTKVDVVIVGAGAAGLAAARELAAAGVTFLILEARARTGGRIWTYRDPRSIAPVEMGAEFLHGDTPLTNEILREAGFAAHEVTGEHWRAKDGSFRKLDDYWDQIGKVMSHLDPDKTPDQSFDDYLHSTLTTYLRPRTRRLAHEFVEGFHAADASRISERVLAQGAGNEEDRMGRITDGYEQIPMWIAKDLPMNLVFNTVVKRIEWKKHEVRIEARSIDESSSSVYSARAVIVTVPLSVLQQSSDEAAAIEFVPAIPEMRAAISQLAMGHVVRIMFAFSEPFWENRLRNVPEGSAPYALSFLHGEDTKFRTWWTLFPVRSSVLVGWVGGPQAEALLLQGEAAIKEEAIASLARITGLTTDELHSLLLESWMHDWSADPFAGGAYSYALVGGDKAAEQLAQPTQETVFFAGEATATEGKTGTVEGALASGRQAARSLLYSLDSSRSFMSEDTRA